MIYEKQILAGFECTVLQVHNQAHYQFQLQKHSRFEDLLLTNTQNKRD